MKLKDVQGGVQETITISARIPKDYKEFIDKNKINIRKLVCKAVDELQKRVK